MKMNKYHNVKTKEHGITFDSKKEAARYLELMDELKRGTIRNLKLQPSYTLQEAYTTPSGERIRAITYKADFEYLRPSNDTDIIDWRQKAYCGWTLVTEDVKGTKATRTPEFELKRKLFSQNFGYEITII